MVQHRIGRRQYFNLRITTLLISLPDENNDASVTRSTKVHIISRFHLMTQINI